MELFLGVFNCVTLHLLAVLKKRQCTLTAWLISVSPDRDVSVSVSPDY